MADDQYSSPSRPVTRSATTKTTKPILSTDKPKPRVVGWSVDVMANAIDTVFAGEMNRTNASREFKVPRTTLLDRLSFKMKKKDLLSPGSPPLNENSDNLMVNFVSSNIESMDKKTLIKSYSIQYAEELAHFQGTPFKGPLHSRKWLKLFPLEV